VKCADSLYAIKVLSKAAIIRRKQVGHVADEYKTLRALKDHPYAIQLYSTFTDDLNLYFCLEYGEGGELFTVLRGVGKFSEDLTRFYTSEILCCLDFLHSKSIVYRDLKPENVLFSREGHIKLCDFGFSKVVTDRAWTLCGTPEYMAPEIILGKGHSKGVDFWSLGIFIFELLSGVPPFFGNDTVEIYESIVTGVYSFPSHFSIAAQDLIGELLHQKASKRLGNHIGGISAIHNHPFYHGVDWKAVYAKEVKAPPIPNCEQKSFENIPQEPFRPPRKSSDRTDFGEIFDFWHY